jgi:hypothetical protein
LEAGLVERGAFFDFFCVEGTFSVLLAGGLGEAAFGAGLSEAFDDGGDLSEDLGDRFRPSPFFLGLLLFFFCTFDGEISTAAAAF